MTETESSVSTRAGCERIERVVASRFLLVHEGLVARNLHHLTRRNLDAVGFFGTPICGRGWWAVAALADTPEETLNPVQVRLTLGPQQWAVEPGEHAFGSAFALLQRNAVQAVSHDPALLAAIGGRKIDPIAVLECLRFGFPLQRRTLFTDVVRLVPGEYAGSEFSAGSPAVDRNPRPCAWNDMVQALSPGLQSLATQDYAIELSGGLDSRLVLALAIAAGAKPKLAITLGGLESADVLAATEICRTLSIEHRIIAIGADADQIVDDAHAFVRFSGYMANATSYAWLPAVFRKLSNIRCGQITGAGGECATGFYFTPLDPLFNAGHFHKLWVQYRLAVPGAISGSLFRRSIAGDLERCATQDALSGVICDCDAGTWRDRVVHFYRDQRVRQWAAPVLTASNNWYKVAAPLLHAAFLGWAESLSEQQRAGRRAQRELLRNLNTSLSDIPYAEHFARKPPLLTRLARRALKYRAAAPAGAEGTALTLLRDSKIRAQLDQLLAANAEFWDEQQFRRICTRPSHFAHEVGVLVTAAIAQTALDDARARLDAA
jgi:hypothetical protein